MKNIYPNFLHSAILSLPLILLTSCATASRGSQTYFVVETFPTGAKVFTDMEIPNSSSNEYYSCAETPCKISMPRRSQFNIMITKEGYAPFFYVVRKRSHKELKKDFEDRKAFHLNSNGDLLNSDDVSKNAGLSATGSNPSMSAATGTVLGAWYTGETISAFAISGTLSAPVAVTIAGPALLTGYGVDLTSGALLDLTPNPMKVQLAPEQNLEESKRLKAAFLASRKKE